MASWQCSCGLRGVPQEANYYPDCGTRLFAKDLAQSSWEWRGLKLDEAEQYSWFLIVARVLLAETERLCRDFGDHDHETFLVTQKPRVALDGQEYRLFLDYEPGVVEGGRARPIESIQIGVRPKCGQDPAASSVEEYLDFEQLRQRFAPEVIHQWACKLYDSVAGRAYWISLANFARTV